MKRLKLNLRDLKTRTALILLAFGIVLSVFIYFKVLIPAREDLDKLKTTYNTKNSELNNILALKPRLAQMRKEYALDSIRLDSLKGIFPDREQIPMIIQEITNISKKAGISAVKFFPLSNVEKEYYIINRYSVVVRGSYHQLGSFFSHMANISLIVNLENVDIKSLVANNYSDNMSESGIPVIKASFDMSTFSSKE